MEKFDLTAALKTYRTEHKLSIRQMASKLNMSKSAYDRLEKGWTKPTYDEVPRILSLLDLQIDSIRIEAVKPAPLKWYKSKKLRWIKPIIGSYFVLSFITELRGFRIGYGGEQAMAENPPTPVMIVLGAIYCVFYWYYYPPQWPFTKPAIAEKNIKENGLTDPSVS